MAYGQRQFNVVIASGASTASLVDLGSYKSSLFVYVSTMSTAAAINLQDSPDGGTTFYNKFVYVASGTTQAVAMNIASSVGTNGGAIHLPFGGRYLRLMATGVVSGGVLLKVLAND
jgi:hypothetical protein